MASQIDIVHSTLITEGKIDSWSAITRFHITRLAEYIRQLRAMGLNIVSNWKEKDGKRWVEYVYETTSPQVFTEKVGA